MNKKSTLLTVSLVGVTAYFLYKRERGVMQILERDYPLIMRKLDPAAKQALHQRIVSGLYQQSGSESDLIAWLMPPQLSSYPSLSQEMFHLENVWYLAHEVEKLELFAKIQSMATFSTPREWIAWLEKVASDPRHPAFSLLPVEIHSKGPYYRTFYIEELASSLVGPAAGKLAMKRLYYQKLSALLLPKSRAFLDRVSQTLKEQQQLEAMHHALRLFSQPYGK